MERERNLLHAHRHIRTMELAAECAGLGARVRTIQLLTGLSPSQLERLFRQPLGGIRRGRHPDSTEWYHTANLPCRAEASIVVALFRRLISRGIDPPYALVGAYHHYRSFCKADPRISFDRAFDLSAHSTGRWLVSGRSFSVFTCPTCRSEYLTSLSTEPHSNHECPFCRLLERYPRDRRIRATYPACPTPHEVQTLWVKACWHQRLPIDLTANSP